MSGDDFQALLFQRNIGCNSPYIACNKLLAAQPQNTPVFHEVQDVKNEPRAAGRKASWALVYFDISINLGFLFFGVDGSAWLVLMKC